MTSATPPPAITDFLANPTAITVGASAQLTGVFANGLGLITPGNLPATSGVAVSVTPAATTTYTLTVTSPSGVSVSQDGGVMVVPAGSEVTTPNSVQVSGGQQTTAGGAYGNGAVVGESIPAVVSTSASGAFQLRSDFYPPLPGTSD